MPSFALVQKALTTRTISGVGISAKQRHPAGAIALQPGAPADVQPSASLRAARG